MHDSRTGNYARNVSCWLSHKSLSELIFMLTWLGLFSSFESSIAECPELENYLSVAKEQRMQV